ncbi:MAG: hypothetical protein A3J38_09665 [Gammaproteobacteria bacterium RIFCSPHIGHO2_12_FULL_45_9]|nr:MAG: hypothetical protein A3J38_09665 [Gammaproteobacteria bacterium RIFCSPHIGHO2_12_FULL_45_9]
MLSDEEKILFEQAVQKVTPLTAPVRLKRPVQRTARPKRLYKPIASNPEAYFRGDLFFDPAEKARFGGEDSVHFVRGSLHRNTLRQLTRGTLIPEASVDLHMMTRAEALQVMQEFVSHCLATHKRWALVIHGKGSAKQAKPVLKNQVIDWLQEHPSVLAFCSAKPKDGGTGALYVLLKMNAG